MKTRIASITLALLQIALLASCGGDASAPTDTTASGTTAQTSAEIPAETSGVPSGTSLNGEVINIWTTTVSPYTTLDGEQSGDVLDDAVYSLNQTIEERLNCDLVFHDTGTEQSACNTAIRQILMADDTSYDLYNPTQWSGGQLVAQGLYLNIADAPYLSLDKPWWDSTYMKEMSIGSDKIYTMMGDYSIDHIRFLNCCYYNKAMYETYYGDPDGLYRTVADGGWSYDLMRQICTETWSDLNSSGSMDTDDQLGVYLNWNGNVQGLFYGSGVRVTQRDDDGIPYLVMNNERTINTMERLYSLLFETEGVLYAGDTSVSLNSITRHFAEGSTMFLCGYFYSCESLREMDDDYGVLPLPKADAEQEDYVGLLHESIRFMALPANCQKVDAVCAVMEEMAYEGWTSLLPVYYETVLKTKYARDDLSSQMIDLIRDNVVSEIAMIYGDSYKGLGNLPRTLMNEGSSDFASKYAAMESAAITASEALIEQFTAIE